MARQVDETFGKAVSSPRRGKRRWRWGLMFLFALLAFVFFLPTIVTSKSLFNQLANRFAGIAPLTVSFDEVRAGWLKPVGVSGVELRDETGNVLAKVGNVATGKGLIGWITNSSSLGTIRIDGLEAFVVAHDGTTNIEEALAPIIASQSTNEPTDDSDSSSASVEGSIELTNAKILLVETGRPEQWVVQIPNLTASLPTASQVIGPIHAEISIGEVAGIVADSVGTIAADVKQVDGGNGFAVDAVMQNISADVWHILKARMPELPVESLSGRVSVNVAGVLEDAERWSFDVRQMETQKLRMDAPELLGDKPAQLATIAAAGKASLDGKTLTLSDARMACDFGSAAATASIPWPIEMPTLASPFLAGATLDARGSVDLPKLVQAAESLIPMREDAQLLNGLAQFAVQQAVDAQAGPTSGVNLTLSGLKANANGQVLEWDEPLTVSLTAATSTAGPKFNGGVKAEFCSLNAGGTMEAGQLAGNVNLDVLHARLSQWIELPLRNMQGAANVSLVWQLNEANELIANGNLETTPLSFAAVGGGEIQEPAWKGTFAAAALLRDSTPIRLNQAKLELLSRDEKLTVDLQEPLQIAEATLSDPALPPAAFTATLVGELANWKRRGTMWLSEPPQIDVQGMADVSVSGRLDLNHAEITQASWQSQPLNVSGEGYSFSEGRMTGSFVGQVDTNDLTRLQVERLQVQATSFSLAAQDSANPQGSGRVGQAQFLVDLDRLLRNMQNPAATANAPDATSYSATGRVSGRMQWQVSPEAAGVAVEADGENIVILSKSPTSIAPMPMWNEPQLKSQIAATWQAANNSVDVSKLTLQLPWMNYQGTVAYRTQDLAQQASVRGEALVDTAVLAEKIAPMTGNQLQLVGQETIPVEIDWSSDGSNPNASVLAGLQAKTRVGWQQARVVGIEVGQADVPVRISNGMLATAAEIPVSGGKLRWDLASDLTQTDMVIVQKPMTVLENVEITEEMCKGWLKYVTPLLAEATSIDGRLSLSLDQANLTPTNPLKQTVAGRLVIHNAEVGPGPLSNQIITLVRQIDALRKQDYTQAVSTQKVWMNMPQQQIDFQMVDGRVIHRNLNVKVGDAIISTSGSVSVDGQMEMLATMPIPNDWADKSPLLAGLRGQSLQFPMRGTLSAPQVDTELLRSLGRQTVQSAAQGLIQQGLSKGLGKLFGPPPAAPTGNSPTTTPQ